MTTNPDKPSLDISAGTQPGCLYVADLIRYLSGLMKINSLETTGNKELGEGLRNLIAVLRPYSDHPVSDLVSLFAKARYTLGSRSTSHRTKPVLPVDLGDLRQDAVEPILNDERYTKQQIAELGDQRFGISPSKLIRLSKSDAVDAVRAALEHEKSLDAISREARKTR